MFLFWRAVIISACKNFQSLVTQQIFAKQYIWLKSKRSIMKMGHYAHYNLEKWNFPQIKKGNNSFKKKKNVFFFFCQVCSEIMCRFFFDIFTLLLTQWWFFTKTTTFDVICYILSNVLLVSLYFKFKKIWMAFNWISINFFKKMKKSFIWKFSFCSSNKEHFLPKLKKKCYFFISFSTTNNKIHFFSQKIINLKSTAK